MSAVAYISMNMSMDVNGYQCRLSLNSLMTVLELNSQQLVPTRPAMKLTTTIRQAFLGLYTC